MRRFQTLSVSAAIGCGLCLGTGELEAQPVEPRSSAPARVETNSGLPEASEVPDAHHLRTLGGIAFGLTGMAIGYWTLQATQQADWDYPSLGGRFDGSAWRFDNNQLIINYWLHPLAGAEMYAIARANHHDPLTAAAYSTLGTFLWEFGFEYRELVSVNDMLATSFPGIPVGEFMHKLGVYLDSAENPSTGLEVARWALTPGHRFDRFVDDAPPPYFAARDRYGLRADIWHDFRVQGAAAFGRTSDDATERPSAKSGFEGRLVSLPGYRRPGSVSRFFHSLDFAALTLAAEASAEGPGLEMAAETLVAGWYGQNLDSTRSRKSGASGERTLSGTSAALGVVLAYSYLESYASGFPELFGAFHMPGAKLEGRAESWLGEASLGLRVTPDFVGVGAYGYEDWQALHPGELGKHILRNQGYFYGFGGSGLLRAAATLGPLELDGDVFFGSYRSSEGLNRWQERITLDVPATSDFLRYRGSAAIRLGRLPLSVGANLELRRWNTSIGEVKRAREVVHRGVELEFRF